MVKDKPFLYTCMGCSKPQQSSWSDKEARAELKCRFGDIPAEECGLFCDDCYRSLIDHFKPVGILDGHQGR